MARRRIKQTWLGEESARTRVLLECPSEASPSIIASVVERAGYAVRTCDGPEAGPCDLVCDGVCGLVEGADVVVNMLGYGESGRQVLKLVAEGRRPPGLVVELNRTQAVAAAVDEPHLVDDRVTVVETPVTRRELLDAIASAAAAPERPRPIWGDGFC